MIKRQLQFVFDIFQTGCRVVVVAEQSLTVLDLLNLQRSPIPFYPGLQKFFNFIQLPSILIVQTHEVVILLRAGNQLIQNRPAIVSDREFFDKLNLLTARQIRGNCGHDDSQGSKKKRAENTGRRKHAFAFHD